MKKFIMVSVGLLLAGLTVQVFAANYDVAAGGGNWDDSAIWTPAGGPPTASDNAANTSGSTVTVADGMTATCNWLEMGLGGNDGYLNVTGGSLSMAGGFAMGETSGRYAEATQSGGAVNVAGGMLISTNAGASALYQLKGGSLTVGGTLYVGQSSGAFGKLTQTGGSLYANGPMQIGDNGVYSEYKMTGGSASIFGLTLGGIATSNAMFSLGNSASTGSITMYGNLSNSRGGKIEGWGTVAKNPTTTCAVINDYDATITANGYGTERTLDMSGLDYFWDNNNHQGTGGVYATDMGKLTLPTITVPSGYSFTAWGDANGASLDPVNSLGVEFGPGSSGGSLDISLLSSDRSDVPVGGKFIGVWDFSFLGADPQNDYLNIHYDAVLAAALGIDENNLCLFNYDSNSGTWTDITLNRFLDTDRINALYSGSLNTMFAVGIIPEPTTLAMLGLGGLLLLRKRVLYHF